LQFENVDEYSTYRHEHTLRGDVDISDSYILVPVNPLMDYEMKYVQTVENVYVATYYSVKSDFADMLIGEMQSYEREVSSEAVYVREVYDDPEHALMEGYANKGYEQLKKDSNDYYIKTDNVLSDDGNKQSLIHNIAYIFNGELVYVRFPAFYEIEEMIPYAAVDRLYSSDSKKLNK
jgi:hypothetical protein